VATAAELAVDEQLKPLQEIAAKRNWKFERLDSLRFKIGLTARDGSEFWLLVECDGFPARPPAFHWCDPETGALDVAKATPKGTGYLHEFGRICAPWNRLAYKECDPKGQHGDWQLAGWMTNPHTAGTRTLAAMSLRIYHELRSPNYHGRMA